MVPDLSHLPQIRLQEAAAGGHCPVQLLHRLGNQKLAVSPPNLGVRALTV